MRIQSISFLPSLLLTSALLASCGGGSGSSSSTVTPQPVVVTPPPVVVTPPQPQPPTIIAALSKSLVWESELFSIDLDGSTADDANIDTFDIKQVSGLPVKDLERTNFYYYNFQAPDYDFDGMQSIEFEITATDTAGRVSVKTILLSVEGFGGTGVPIARYETPVELIGGDGSGRGSGGGYDGIFLSEADIPSLPDGSVNFKFYGANNSSDVPKNYNEAADESFFDEDTTPVTNVNYIVKGRLEFNLRPSLGTDIVVLNKESDEFIWYAGVSERDEANTKWLKRYSKQDSFAIEDPCFFTGRQNTGQDYIWVGQENNGASLVQLDPVRNDQGYADSFNETVLQKFGGQRSLCLIYPTEIQDNIVPGFTTYSDGGYPGFIGVDYNTNELAIYGDLGDDKSYEELTTIPLQTNSTEELKIVDFFADWTSSKPDFFGVLLTDGKENGIHRLVIITFSDGFSDEPNKIKQQTLSWTGGVPFRVLNGTFGGINPGNQFLQDLVVVTETSDASMFFDNITELAGANNSQGPLVWAEGVPFQTDPGIASAVKMDMHHDISEFFAQNAIGAYYPESGLVRRITLPFTESDD